MARSVQISVDNMFSKANLKNEIKHEWHALCILVIKQLQLKLLKVEGTMNTVAVLIFREIQVLTTNSITNMYRIVLIALCSLGKSTIQFAVITALPRHHLKTDTSTLMWAVA